MDDARRFKNAQVFGNRGLRKSDRIDYCSANAARCGLQQAQDANAGWMGKRLGKGRNGFFVIDHTGFTKGIRFDYRRFTMGWRAKQPQIRENREFGGGRDP